MKIHFIAIGGSAMHNLAIALQKKGLQITGSDDEIFEPSAGRLNAYGLLPNPVGWYPEKITQDIDAIVLGMHAREDNPELLKAKELGIKVFSYPEYLYEQSKDKIRVVIGGSHGKTSITAMILHTLRTIGIPCDYMVGAQIKGFDTMVKLSDAAIIILEGDEYLSSPIDRRPKFHLYHPNIALLSGIAWDHINVFPTFENYVKQFEIFIDKIENKGTLIYCESDSVVVRVVNNTKNNISCIPYVAHNNVIRDGITYLVDREHEIPLQIFGEHNLQNCNGARLICKQLGVADSDFYGAMRSFKGAGKRLEKVAEKDDVIIYKDFAHSPSKLKGTTQAVKKQFPNRKLVACMELHTFSSLTHEFLEQYKNTLDDVDVPIIYFNPIAVAHKKLTPITPEQVRIAFDNQNIKVYTDSKKIIADLRNMNWVNTNLLLMSSGNFNGMNFSELAIELLGKESTKKFQ